MRFGRRTFVGAIATTFGLGSGTAVTESRKQAGSRHPWPTHGGSNERTSYRPDLSPPMQDLNVEWETPVGTPGNQSEDHREPIVTENYVVAPGFSTADSGTEPVVVSALDREDGSTAWTARDASEGDNVSTIETLGQTVVGDTIYVTRTTYTFMPSVYAGANVYAVNLKDGRIEWSASGDSQEAPFAGAPLVYDTEQGDRRTEPPDKVIIGQSYPLDGPLLAFNRNDGSRVWDSKEQPGGKGYAATSSPALGQDKAYIGSRNRGVLQFNPNSMNTPTGGVNVAPFSTDRSSVSLRVSVTPSQEADDPTEIVDGDGTIVANRSDLVGAYFVADPDGTGDPFTSRWEFDLHDNDILSASEGEQSVLNGDPIQTQNRVVVPIASEPGVTGRLLCFGKREGELQWKTDFEEAVWCASADRFFVYACTGRKLVVADLQTGTVQSEVELGKLGIRGPVLTDEGLYVLASDERELNSDHYVLKVSGSRTEITTSTTATTTRQTTDRTTTAKITSEKPKRTSMETEESATGVPGFGIGTGALAAGAGLATAWYRSRTNGDDEE